MEHGFSPPRLCAAHGGFGISINKALKKVLAIQFGTDTNLVLYTTNEALSLTINKASLKGGVRLSLNSDVLTSFPPPRHVRTLPPQFAVRHCTWSLQELLRRDNDGRRGLRGRWGSQAGTRPATNDDALLNVTSQKLN